MLYKRLMLCKILVVALPSLAMIIVTATTSVQYTGFAMIGVMVIVGLIRVLSASTWRIFKLLASSRDKREKLRKATQKLSKIVDAYKLTISKLYYNKVNPEEAVIEFDRLYASLQMGFVYPDILCTSRLQTKCCKLAKIHIRQFYSKLYLHDKHKHIEFLLKEAEESFWEDDNADALKQLNDVSLMLLHYHGQEIQRFYNDTYRIKSYINTRLKEYIKTPPKEFYPLLGRLDSNLERVREILVSINEETAITWLY